MVKPFLNWKFIKNSNLIQAMKNTKFIRKPNLSEYRIFKKFLCNRL